MHLENDGLNQFKQVSVLLGFSEKKRKTASSASLTAAFSIMGTGI